MLAAQKRAVEVHRHDPAPGRKIGVLDAAGRGDSRRVDETVEPAGGALDLGDDAQPILLRSHVERVIHAGAAAEVRGDCDRAGFHDRVGGRRADGARGPGHQHDLVSETTHRVLLKHAAVVPEPERSEGIRDP